MISSRIRDLRPIEFVILATLVMADVNGEGAGEARGQVGMAELQESCKPMPIGQAVGELIRMKLVQHPLKSNDKPIIDKLVVTTAGEAAMMAQRLDIVKRLEGESKKIDAQDGDEVKARKAEWAAAIKRVKEAVAEVASAVQPPAEVPS